MQKLSADVACFFISINTGKNVENDEQCDNVEIEQCHVMMNGIWDNWFVQAGLDIWILEIW